MSRAEANRAFGVPKRPSATASYAPHFVAARPLTKPSSTHGKISRSV